MAKQMGVKFEIGSVHPPLFPDAVPENRHHIPATGANVTLTFKVKNVGTVPFAPYFHIRVSNAHTLVDEDSKFAAQIGVGQTGTIEHTYFDDGTILDGQDRDVELTLYEKAGHSGKIGEKARWDDAYFMSEVIIELQIVSLTVS